MSVTLSQRSLRSRGVCTYALGPRNCLGLALLRFPRLHSPCEDWCEGALAGSARLSMLPPKVGPLRRWRPPFDMGLVVGG